MTAPESLDEIETAIWRELRACLVDRAHGWRTPVLATTDAGGDADARTLVLREVVPQRRCLRFFTDARSPKAGQLRHRPRGMLVMWSPALGWQLRLAVRLALVADGPEVSARWQRLAGSPAAADYLSPGAPGSPLEGADVAAEGGGPVAAAAGHLALVDATVETIDWLALDARGHRRARFEPAGARWIQP